MRTATLMFLLMGAATGSAHAATVRGTVLGPDEQPVPGVSITFASAGSAPRVVTTGEQGRYQIDDLTVGTWVGLTRKDGFAPQRQSVRITGVAQVLGVWFRLKPRVAEPWSVTGEVTREDGGAPVPGASVALLTGERPPLVRTAEAKSNDKGQYAFTGLAAGVYHVVAGSPECLPRRAGPIELHDGAEHQTVDVVLTPGCVISGTLKRPDGTPVADVEAMVWRHEAVRPTQGAGMRVRTGPDGTYRLGPMPAGTYRLIYEVPGFRVAVREGISVAPGRPAEGIEMRLDAGLAVRGRVLKPDGTPAPGAKVECGQPQRRYTTSSTTAGEDGAFEWTGWQEGELRLRASLVGFGPDETSVVLPQPEGAGVEVRLQPAFTLRGTIRDEMGNVVPNAFLYWRPTKHGYWGVSAQYSMRSRLDGKFEFTDVAAAEIQVYVQPMKGGLRDVNLKRDFTGQTDEATWDIVAPRAQ